MLPLELDDARKYIENLEGELRTRFGSRNKIIDDMRDLYFLEHHKGRVPEAGETLITTSKATNIVDLGVGILSSNPMRIRVYSGVGETEESKNASNHVERFLRAALYINNERYETDIEVESITDQLRDGWAAIYSYWDRDTEKDEQGYKELPVHLKVVEVKNLYWDEGGPRGKYRSFVYSCDREVRSIEEEWGVEIPGFESLDSKKQKVKYVDYWEWQKVSQEPLAQQEQVKDELGDVVGMQDVQISQPDVWVLVNAITADSRWVKEPEFMFGYDDIPYTIIPGRLTRNEDPGKRALSLLFPTAQKIRDLNNQLTHHRRLVNLYAAMQPVIETQDGVEPPNVDSVLGKPIMLRTGERMYFPQWPGTPPDVDKALADTKEEIQEGSFPSVAFGQGTDSSGYGMSLLNDSGRTRLYQFQRNLERAWSSVFRKILSLAANFAPNDSLPAYGRLHGAAFYMPIVGGDMKGFRVDVAIKPDFPQDKAQRVTQATQLKAQGIVSDWTIWEDTLGIEQPDEEQNRMMQQRVMEDPAVMKAAIKKYLGVYDPEGAKAFESTQEQNQMAQATMGQPPSQRPSGELPPSSVMPQEMAGIMPPQATGGVPPGQELPPELIQLLNQIGGPGVG